MGVESRLTEALIDELQDAIYNIRDIPNHQVIYPSLVISNISVLEKRLEGLNNYLRFLSDYQRSYYDWGSFIVATSVNGDIDVQSYTDYIYSLVYTDIGDNPF
jgi:hypothetical protein